MLLPEHCPNYMLSKTRVAVGLQDSAEVFEVRTGMLPLAIRRVSKPHSRWRRLTGGTVVADIRPQTSRFGFAGARSECANRSVVVVDFVASSGGLPLKSFAY